MAKKNKYPTGVRPLLIAESARRKRVEARITGILERAGFDEVILPIIDYADPYATTGAVDGRQTYRFVDRDGDLVAVRSDFTPMVARALAPTLTPDQLPLRVFYRGDVVRYAVSRLGANREMFQVGAEIIGDSSAAADVEVLKLVSSILSDFGTEPLIVFTDSTLPERLAGSAAGKPGANLVREALAAKRAADVSRLDGSIPEEAMQLVGKLVAGSATTADLRGFADTREIAARLDEISQGCGTNCVIHLDDVDREGGYYTGLRFRAYDSASRNVLAQGGRYDTLYGRFGAAAPAVGFTLTIDELNGSETE